MIVAQQRSGTHFLQSLLNSHSRIGGAGEVFHHKASRYNFYSYWAARVAENPDAIRPGQIGAVWKSFVGELHDSLAKKRVAIILMYNQADSLLPNFYGRLVRSTPIIHLVRMNVLRTHISDFINRTRAKPTHTRQQTDLAKIELPLEELVDHLRQRVAAIERMRALLVDHPAALEVTYESLVQSRSERTAEILNFLHQPYEDLTTTLQMTNPWPLQDILLNYDALQRLLSTTEFAWTLTVPSDRLPVGFPSSAL